jgi:hypothetical protein
MWLALAAGDTHTAHELRSRGYAKDLGVNTMLVVEEEQRREPVDVPIAFAIC